jgi:Peptidase family S41
MDLLPTGRQIARRIGALELPAIVGSTEQVQGYAASAQHMIRELDELGIDGWIVDLRRNTGGNMWPMLAGAGPILGEGELGAFVFCKIVKRSEILSSASMRSRRHNLARRSPLTDILAIDRRRH